MTLEQVYRDYSDKVSRFVHKKVANADEADDLVSEVFLKLTRNWSRFDSSKASISTWVYTVANNTVIDYYRTRKPSYEIPDESETTRGLPETLIDFVQPDAALLQAEQLRELAKALMTLSQRDRDLIILHYYQNMTLKAAAERIGMSYANAKLVHKKALEKLSGILKKG